MKVSLNWLTDYVKVSMPAKQLGELFMRIGFNIEEIVETDTDVVLDLEITSNRPDMLGHIGVARELAAAAGLEFRPPAIGKVATSGKAGELTSVQVLDADLCPRYTARIIRGVKVGPSPAWMVERLASVGMRSINNIVDVTNYILLEYSQPLHSFDYDKLHEHRIVVRRAADGEMLVSIDGTKCHLDSGMLVIADAARPVAIAGIMGGLDSEVSDATVNVLLESAQFDPLTTRRTSRKLGILSESNYRFERGIDPVGLDEASRRACQLIVELAGGTVADGVVDVWAKAFVAPAVALRPERTNKVLGIDVPVQRQRQILAGLGLAPRLEGGKIVCTIPPYRRDLTREIDLIEEVARLHGYDQVPTYGRISHAVAPQDRAVGVRRQAATALQAAGYDECITVSFNDAQEAALFGFDGGVAVDPLVRKTNSTLRPTLLGSLLRVCKTNQDSGNMDVRLFELAAVFPPAIKGSGTFIAEAAKPVAHNRQHGIKVPDPFIAEHVELALVSSGDLAQLRGAAEAAIHRVDANAVVDVRPLDAPAFAPGAAGQILLDGKPVGIIGSLAPATLDYYGLEHAVTAATVNFTLLQERGGKVRRFAALPRFPAVRRDLSLVVDEPVTWQQLAAAVAAVAQPMRVAVDYVTTYRGRPIPDGRKSMTVTLTYRSSEGTLRGEQVDEQVAQVVESLKASIAAQLRA